MTNLPKLTPIESSMFTAQAYDPDSRVLTVQFKNGAIHQYDDVPADKHFAFVGAQSPGRYFNEKIKSNHLSRKIAEGKP
jgi:hypothetical protein